MISGYLFFGERSAQPRHFLRIGLCLLFYSTVALLLHCAIYLHQCGVSAENLLQSQCFTIYGFFSRLQ